MNRKVILMILDGWGISKNPKVSAIDRANTPFMDFCLANYPNAQLLASGEAVGLPDGQMGNSEVGHMNLGAGRVVYQNLLRINIGIKDGTFFKRPNLQLALKKAKEGDKNLHLMGLLSDGGVHSHINHLKAILEACHSEGLEKVYVHAFTDGRDVDPKSGLSHLEEIEKFMEEKTGSLATIIGRYYAMDRDHRWERTKRAYDTLVHSTGNQVNDFREAVKQLYKKGITDEFLEPIVLLDEKNDPVAAIEDQDIVLCFNFRTDRARQISSVLTQKSIEEYSLKTLNIECFTMTNYDKTFQNIHVIYDNEDLIDTLGEVLSKAGKKQIRVAETEKYPHVTFFFSCGREIIFEGEDRILCPSPKVATYDLKPEMSAFDVRDRLLIELEKGEVDFVCLNFANPDMVGHTGDMQAAIKACETVDLCTKEVVEVAQKNNYEVIIISDHGNADCMENENGSPNTAHTTQPVPYIFISKEKNITLANGRLCDIAPTILNRMNIKQPTTMTGQSLIILHPV